jgi:hypothetical protein
MLAVQCVVILIRVSRIRRGTPLLQTPRIIPFSVNSNQDKSDIARLPSPTVAHLALNCYYSVLARLVQLLERVGGVVPAELHGKLISRLSNIIALNAVHDASFDHLEWWMEPASSGVRTIR